MKTDDSWSVAVELVARFLKKPARMSHLLEHLPPEWDGGRRRACQSLVFGTIRHLRLLEKTLDDYLRRRPKPGTMAALLVATRELMETPERKAQIVHHAVERIGRRFSKAEKGMANAVLRKVPDGLARRMAEAGEDASTLAWRYSHPEWLVQRWLDGFGLDGTRELLRWNQSEPQLYGRWQRNPETLDVLEESPWAGFFRLGEESWERLAPYLESGRFYMQNPAAGTAPTALAERFEGGRALDLCSAPGGKAMLLEALLGDRLEELVAVDLPGPRLERLKGNLERYGCERISVKAADATELGPEEMGRFAAVLLDAPCSNSGVLQRKIDARWRFREATLKQLLALQQRLLERASALVAEGGTLVYSTCSVDPDENEGQVAAFLASTAGAGFTLESSQRILPWKEGRDGAGVFVLRRSSPEPVA